MPEENLETMLAYLREHSGRYSLGALRGQLLAAGHSPEDADRAIAEFRAQSPPEKPAWRLALLVAAADLAVLGLLVALAFAEPDLPDFFIGVAVFALPALCLAEIVGGAVMLAFPAKRHLGRGLLFGGLLFVGLMILVVGGFCLVMVTSYH